MLLKSVTGRPFILCGVAASALLSVSSAIADDETRPSIVGARLERKYVFDTEDYNVKIGPVSFKADAYLRTDFNDNITLAQNHPVSDFIITPAVDLSMFWPVTPFNALRLNAQLGYSLYTRHSELNTPATAFSIAPDSFLDYDIYIDNFTVNIHDRFALYQNPVNEPTLSNVPYYGHFVNTAGLAISWDVNRDLMATIGYDHTNDIPTSSNFDFTQYDDDQFSMSLRYALAPHVAAGLEGSAASVRYRTGEKPDATPVSVGPFIDWNITPYTRLRLAGGYQGIFYNGSTTDSIQFVPGTSATTNPILLKEKAHVSDQNSPYFNLEVSNRLSRHFQQTFSAGHEVSLDITAASAELYYIRYFTTWEINSTFALHGNVFFDEGRQDGSDLPEHFDRIGCGVATSVRLGPKLTSDLSYQFIHKNSDLEGNSYYQNVVSLSLRYSF